MDSDSNDSTTSVCPQQPSLVTEVYDRMGTDSNIRVCLFRSITDLDGTALHQLASHVSLNEKNSVPDSQGWSRCQNCGWDQGKFLLIQSTVEDKNANATSRIELSWSLWGEFFHWFRNDQIHGDVVKNEYINTILQRNRDDNVLSYYIDRPVYILPMITLHVGHVLIDLLEQVYWSMMKTYGKVRRDALFILDVANEDEREVLQEKIYINGYKFDTFYAIITLFTDVPIFAVDLLHLLSAQRNFILFKDLHLGLDLADTYYYRGYSMHPHVFPAPDEHSNREVFLLSERYVHFQQYVLKSIKNAFILRGLSGGQSTICTTELLERHWGNAASLSSDVNGAHQQPPPSPSPQSPQSSQSSQSPQPPPQSPQSPQSPPSRRQPRVLFVQREKNRAISNLHPLVQAGSS